MVNIASNAHYIFALLALIALAAVVRQHRAGSSGRLLSHDALHTYGRPLLALVESSDETRRRELGVALGKMRERQQSRKGGTEQMWSTVDSFLRKEEQLSIDLRANLSSAEAKSARLRGELASMGQRLRSTEVQLHDASLRAVRGGGSAGAAAPRFPLGEANTCSSRGWSEVARQHAIAHRRPAAAAAAVAFASSQAAKAAATLLAERAQLVATLLQRRKCAFWLVGHSLHAYVESTTKADGAPLPDEASASPSLHLGVHRAELTDGVVAALARKGLVAAAWTASAGPTTPPLPCAFRDAAGRIALRITAFATARDFVWHERCVFSPAAAAVAGAGAALAEDGVADAATNAALSAAYPLFVLQRAAFAGIDVQVPRESRRFLLEGRGSSLGFGARRGPTPGRALGSRAVRRCNKEARPPPTVSQQQRRRRLLGQTTTQQKCAAWQLKYTVVPGSSWGSMPVSLRGSWSAADCDYALGHSDYPGSSADSAGTARRKKVVRASRARTALQQQQRGADVPINDSAADMCKDTCESANDGTCDDGGAGSDFHSCVLGTDCTDCGRRSSALALAAAAASASSYTAPFAAAARGAAAVASAGALCSDSCDTANDGYCDDGGQDAAFFSCKLGTDCTDCGERSGSAAGSAHAAKAAAGSVGAFASSYGMGLGYANGGAQPVVHHQQQRQRQRSVVGARALSEEDEDDLFSSTLDRWQYEPLEGVHMVTSGESLASIAKLRGVTVATLLALNNKLNSNEEEEDSLRTNDEILYALTAGEKVDALQLLAAGLGAGVEVLADWNGRSRAFIPVTVTHVCNQVRDCIYLFMFTFFSLVYELYATHSHVVFCLLPANARALSAALSLALSVRRLHLPVACATSRCPG